MSHQEDLSANPVESFYHVVPSGDWVLLPRALAEGHPLFGVRDWAKFLGLGLFVFFSIHLLFFIHILMNIIEYELYVLIFVGITLVLSFVSGVQLFYQHYGFIDSLSAMIVFYAGYNILALFDGIFSGVKNLTYVILNKSVDLETANLHGTIIWYEIVLFSLQCIISVVICLIVALYFINSKQISVTFYHRILADDPYLQKK